MSRADDIIAFCEKYLIVPEGADVGKPMRMRPWQRKIIAGIYDGDDVRRAIISLARKNGKTGLAAMLLLAHLVGPEARRNAQIYSTAQSRDQASIVFGISQSGRLIQTMLLRGLHVDEDGSPVFDGAFIHVAGGGKGGFD